MRKRERRVPRSQVAKDSFHPGLTVAECDAVDQDQALIRHFGQPLIKSEQQLVWLVRAVKVEKVDGAVGEGVVTFAGRRRQELRKSLIFRVEVLKHAPIDLLADCHE